MRISARTSHSKLLRKRHVVCQSVPRSRITASLAAAFLHVLIRLIYYGPNRDDKPSTPAIGLASGHLAAIALYT